MNKINDLKILWTRNHTAINSTGQGMPESYPGGYEKFIDDPYPLYRRLTKLFGKNASVIAPATNEMRESMLTGKIEDEADSDDETEDSLHGQNNDEGDVDKGDAEDFIQTDIDNIPINNNNIPINNSSIMNINNNKATIPQQTLASTSSTLPAKQQKQQQKVITTGKINQVDIDQMKSFLAMHVQNLQNMANNSQNSNGGASVHTTSHNNGALQERTSRQQEEIFLLTKQREEKKNKIVSLEMEREVKKSRLEHSKILCQLLDDGWDNKWIRSNFPTCGELLPQKEKRLSNNPITNNHQNDNRRNNERSIKDIHGHNNKPEVNERSIIVWNNNLGYNNDRHSNVHRNNPIYNYNNDRSDNDCSNYSHYNSNNNDNELEYSDNEELAEGLEAKLVVRAM
jgi:hypothetical protein